MKTESRFLPSSDVSSLVDLMGPKLGETWWLFVVLDSARGNLTEAQRFLAPQLEREQVTFLWQPEGLWLPGKELLNPFVISQTVVPFSAAFIFPSTRTNCSKPRFDLTTDRGQFSEDEVRAASDELASLGAIAYAADGGGLQVVSADQDVLRAAEKIQSG